MESMNSWIKSMKSYCDPIADARRVAAPARSMCRSNPNADKYVSCGQNSTRVSRKESIVTDGTPAVFTVTLGSRRGHIPFGIHEGMPIRYTSSSCRPASPAPVSTTVSLSLVLTRQRLNSASQSLTRLAGAKTRMRRACPWRRRGPARGRWPAATCRDRGRRRGRRRWPTAGRASARRRAGEDAAPR